MAGLSGPAQQAQALFSPLRGQLTRKKTHFHRGFWKSRGFS